MHSALTLATEGLAGFLAVDLPDMVRKCGESLEARRSAVRDTPEQVQREVVTA